MQPTMDIIFRSIPYLIFMLYFASNSLTPVTSAVTHSSNSVKGTDGHDDKHLTKVFIEEKKAKSLIRKRRGWGSFREKYIKPVIHPLKPIWGENNNEDSERREEANEQNRREAAAEAVQLGRICAASCWGGWSGYSVCSAQCGHSGTQRATRNKTPSSQCRAWQQANPNGCQGVDYKTRNCATPCLNGGRANNGCACSPPFVGTCCETRVTCQSTGAVAGGTVSPSAASYPYGNSVSISCERGRRLVGQASRTCQSSGQWSGSQPTCQVISCGAPAKPANTRFTATGGYTYGSTARYSCISAAYRLSGTAVLRCEESGRWSHSPPTCQQIVCPAPPHVANGDVATPNGLIWSSQAQYSCNSGYYLTPPGGATLTCTGDGSWNAGPPTCMLIKCDTLAIPIHGSVKYSNSLNHGSAASFSCDVGYAVKGTASRTCGGSGPRGTWSGTPATCTIVSCSDPGTPAHGTRSGTSLTFGSRVSYQCLPGYFLSNGHVTRTCQADKTWSNMAPTCSACPLNTYLPRTNIESRCISCDTNSHTGNTASSAKSACICDSGYRGRPGGPCEKIICPALIAPDHATRAQCGTNYNDMCRYACERGYVHEAGDDVRKCGYDSTWSGADIVCKACKIHTYPSGPYTCSPCPPYSHAYTLDEALQGCLCDGGFLKYSGKCTDKDECVENNGGCAQACENEEGSYRCYCTDPGTLIDEDDPSSCVGANQCSALEPVDNGGFVCLAQKRTNTQRCQVKCNKGFEHGFAPNAFETCGPDTDWQWSHDLNNIPILPCYVPDFAGLQQEIDIFYFVSNCDDLDSGNILGIKAEFLNFLTEESLCTASGLLGCTIDDVRIDCGEVTDTAPEYDDYYDYNYDDYYDYNYDDYSDYNHDFGFRKRRRRQAAPSSRLRLSVKVSIPQRPRSDVDCEQVCVRQSYCESRCEENYAAATKESVKKSIKQLTTAADKVLESKLVTTVQRKVVLRPPTLACGEGRIPFNATCEWRCELPSTPVHGHVEAEDGPIIRGNRLTYTCDIGFQLVGSAAAVCEGESGWSAEPPTCEVCQMHTYKSLINSRECDKCPPHSKTRNTGSTSPKQCHCVKGYYGPDGGPCKAILCLAAESPQNGVVSASDGSAFGSIVIFACKIGFVREGIEKRTCGGTEEIGIWSGEQPRCKAIVCPAAEAPQNGIASTGDGSAFGSVATFSCNIGFLRDGVEKRTCGGKEAIGTWSGEQPRCKELCIRNCNGLADGDYQSCESCSVYETCSNSYMISGRPCNPGTVWDDRKKRCEWTTTTCAPSTSEGDPPSGTSLSTTTETSTSNSGCASSCKGLPPGDYQSCLGCHVFITCTTVAEYDGRPCPGGLVWDDTIKACDWTSTTCPLPTN